MSQDVVTCPMCSKHCITGTLAHTTCELLAAQKADVTADPIKDDNEPIE